ncbi:translation initiation factor IF-1, partial [Dysosmobacter welbionis]
RGLFVFGYEGQRDTPPFVPDFVLIADVVFIQQSARLHIQILAQRISRHAGMDGTGKLGGRGCPYRLICGHQP